MAFLRTFGLIALTVVFILFSLFVYTKLAGPIPFSVTSTTTQKSDAFSVTGEGKASITPDKATVRLGVIADGATADVAKNKMNEVINKVTTELKALGIADKDIKTENLNVYENYDNRPLPAEKVVTPPAVQDPNSRAVSYRANTTLVVVAGKIDLAEKVIDVGTKNGINQIGGVQFNNVDKTNAENEARIKAVADAKAKAETAAKAAGFNLGKIINYQEGGRGESPLMYNKTMTAGSNQDSAQTELNPGENEVVMTVTLSYEVR